jgi:hypothetical protein
MGGKVLVTSRTKILLTLFIPGKVLESQNSSKKMSKRVSGRAAQIGQKI